MNLIYRIHVKRCDGVLFLVGPRDNLARGCHDLYSNNIHRLGNYKVQESRDLPITEQTCGFTGNRQNTRLTRPTAILAQYFPNLSMMSNVLYCHISLTSNIDYLQTTLFVIQAGLDTRNPVITLASTISSRGMKHVLSVWLWRVF